MPQYRFSEIKDRLDDWRVFNSMVDSPYYRDAVYEKFSATEYERRYQALRSKMRERGLDCVIVPGGPNHWSFGGGMLWLSGHWEWHAMANYVVFPLEGEPTLIYSMGGTHIEATRRESAIKDVRQSRGGLRRLVTGMVVGCPRRRSAHVRNGLAFAGAARAPLPSCCRGGRSHRGVSRLDLAALHPASRRRVAGS